MINGMFGGMWFGWLLGIVIIVLVIWVVIQISNKNQQTNSTNMIGKESPLDILKKRYAKGEITKEQFEEMKNDLL